MFFKNEIVILKNNSKADELRNKFLKCSSDEFTDKSGMSYIHWYYR